MLIGEHYFKLKNAGPPWLKHLRNKAINCGYWPDRVLALIATDSLPAVDLLEPTFSWQVFSCSVVQRRHNNSTIGILTDCLWNTSWRHGRQSAAVRSKGHIVLLVEKKKGRGFEFYPGRKLKKCKCRRFLISVFVISLGYYYYYYYILILFLLM